MSAYVDNFTIIMLDASKVEMVCSNVKEYESAAGTKINADMLVECEWAPGEAD